MRKCIKIISGILTAIAVIVAAVVMSQKKLNLIWNRYKSWRQDRKDAKASKPERAYIKIESE